MRAVRSLLTLSSTLIALTLAASASAAPPRFVVDVPSELRVSPAKPVESAQIALRKSADIPAHVHLAFDRERVVGGLRVLRFRQEHMGIPVFGRGASIAVDVNGVSRLATSKIEHRMPSSILPKIAPSTAAVTASHVTGLQASAANTRLLVWPTQQGARLVYSVLPPSMLPIPYAPVVIVDADSGQVLTVHNLVRHKNLANVHEFNPVSSPSTIQVELPIGDTLNVPQNDLLVSYNCVDTQKTRPIDYSGFKFDVHVCELLQNAVADDTNEDFLQYELEDHTSGGDPHAQVALFYHAAKAYDYFKQFDPAFELEASSKPLFLIANLMLPAGLDTMDLNKMKDTSIPLEPFSNAFSVGWDPAFGQLVSMIWPEITGGAIAFGQGAEIDYSYDGDVVYHEFGHSVVGTTINLVGWWHLDEQGASASPGSMNEALADFFSSAIAGDPASGEYASQETGDDSIRHLENANTCPAHLAGEVHVDSEFFSAALWATRASLTSDADKFAFDEAIFTAISTAASGDLAFEELAELFVAAVAASSLGQSVGDDLSTQFTSRGVLPACERTFVYDGTPIASKSPELSNSFISAGKSMFAVGSALPYAPGTFQVEVPLPASATAIEASFVQFNASSSMTSPLDPGTPFTPAFIVSFDEPLSFDWANKTSNASDPVDCVALPSSRKGATIDIPDGATKAYVMVVNKGDKDGYFSDLGFGFLLQPDDAGTDAGPQPDVDQPDVDVPEDSGEPSGPAASADDSDDDGCGCRTAGGPSQAPWLAALIALVGVGIARRRNGDTIRR